MRRLVYNAWMALLCGAIIAATLEASFLLVNCLSAFVMCAEVGTWYPDWATYVEQVRVAGQAGGIVSGVGFAASIWPIQKEEHHG